MNKNAVVKEPVIQLKDVLVKKATVDLIVNYNNMNVLKKKILAQEMDYVPLKKDVFVKKVSKVPNVRLLFNHVEQKKNLVQVMELALIMDVDVKKDMKEIIAKSK